MFTAIVIQDILTSLELCALGPTRTTNVEHDPCEISPGGTGHLTLPFCFLQAYWVQSSLSPRFSERYTSVASPYCLARAEKSCLCTISLLKRLVVLWLSRMPSRLGRATDALQRSGYLASLQARPGLNYGTVESDPWCSLLKSHDPLQLENMAPFVGQSG